MRAAVSKSFFVLFRKLSIALNRKEVIFYAILRSKKMKIYLKKQLFSNYYLKNLKLDKNNSHILKCNIYGYLDFSGLNAHNNGVIRKGRYMLLYLTIDPRLGMINPVINNMVMEK
jgi:hypothetical protein